MLKNSIKIKNFKLKINPLSSLVRVLLLPLPLLYRFLPFFRKLPLYLQKATAMALSLLILFSSASSIFLYSPLFRQKAEAAWFNDNWSYRKAITVTVTTSASDIKNLQTLLTIDTDDFITASKLQSDCDDLRFTNTNGDILPYYYDSGCNGNSTKVWVQADLVPKDTTTYTLYMYYGNPSVGTASDNATFYSVKGLVGYWTMNESSWSNNCSTTSVTDSSISGNNGTACPNSTGPTGGASGNYGNAGDFDGSDDYVDTGSTSVTSDWTVAFWGYIDDSVPTIQYPIGTTTGAATGVFVEYNDLSDKWGVTDGSGVLTGSATTESQWYHFTVTKSGTTYTLYLNGTNDGNGTLNDVDISSLEIGRRAGSDAWPFDGKIDDTRVYNRALSSDEIKSLYTNPGSIASTATTTSNPSTALSSEEKAPSPAAYWKFDDGTGTNAQDTTSNNFDGTLTGSSIPTWQTEDQCISGKCLFFNGSSTSYVTVANNATLKLNDSFALSAWVKTSASDDFRYIIDKWDTAGGQSGYRLFQVQTTGALIFQIKDASFQPSVASTASVADGRWHHVVAVRNTTADTLTLYIDGVLVNSANDTTTGSIQNDVNLYIGQSKSEIAVRNWKGFIDEPKIYPFALTAAQIAANYNARGNPEGIAGVLGASDDNSSALSNGLVGYWKMDQSSWNGTASEVVDSSGNANHGTSASGATTAAGKFGNAGSFDGTDDYVTIQPTSTYNFGSNGFSYGMWVNPSAFKASGSHLIDRTVVAYNIINLSIGSSGTVGCSVYGSQFAFSATATSTSTLSTGNWYNLMCVLDKKAGKVFTYVNGELWATGTDSTDSVNLSSVTLKLGNHQNGLIPYQGKMDEFRIYNRALSPAEVGQLYNFAPGPVGYWNFDEKQGTAASDKSGNGYTGTLTGSPTWANGKFGGGLTFSGNDADQYVGNNSWTNITGTVTVSAWAKADSLAQNAWVLSVAETPTTTAKPYILGVLSTGAPYLLLTNSSDTQVAAQGTAGDVTTGSFVHLSGTYDGTTMRVYVNGVQKGSNSQTGAIKSLTTPEVVIGRNTDATSSNYDTWNGVIDDMKVYNYARSAKQIIEDMNAGHPAVGSPVGSPIGHWRFDEGADNTCFGGTNDACNAGSAGSTLDGAQSGIVVPASASSGWLQHGKFGRSMLFDGSDDLIGMGNPSALSFERDQSLTISAWIYPTVTADGSIVSKMTNSTPFTGYDLSFRSASEGGSGCARCLRFHLLNTWATNALAVDSTSQLSLNQWTHVLVAYDGSSGPSGVKLYVNGVATTTTTRVNNLSSSTITASAFQIGSRVSGERFRGAIDEVKVYNYSLTAEEVKLDMNRGSAQVLGAQGDNSSYAGGAANQEYCVPGDSTSCAAPVARWDFEEGNGQTAFDKSGNANNGTLGANGSVASDDPTYKTGKVGKSLNFDGTNDFVSTGTPSFTAATPYTIEAWVKLNAIPATYRTGLVNARYLADNNYTKVLYVSTGGKPGIYVHDGASEHFLDGTTTVQTNTWYHIAATIGASTTQIFVNGKLENTGAYTDAFSSPSQVRIGWGSTAPADPFKLEYTNGQIDQVRIFDYARSAAQVAYDYNRGGPVAHWRLDECQGTQAYDASGNSNTGTLTNTSLGTCQTASTFWGGTGGTGAGKRNYAPTFDGGNDYINIGDPASGLLDFGTGSFTISTWVKGGTFDTAYDGIVSKRSSSNYVGWGLYKQPSNHAVPNSIGIELADTHAGPYYTVRSDTGISTGTWYNITAVADRSSNLLKLYINGALQTSTTSIASLGSVNNATSLLIGAETGINNWDGQIDDVRIYNYALTASQIKLLYNGNFGNFYGPATGAP